MKSRRRRQPIPRTYVEARNSLRFSTRVRVTFATASEVLGGVPGSASPTTTKTMPAMPAPACALRTTGAILSEPAARFAHHVLLDQLLGLPRARGERPARAVLAHDREVHRPAHEAAQVVLAGPDRDRARARPRQVGPQPEPHGSLHRRPRPRQPEPTQHHAGHVTPAVGRVVGEADQERSVGVFLGAGCPEGLAQHRANAYAV